MRISHLSLLTFLFPCLFFSPSALSAQNVGVLTVEIQNVQQAKGSIQIALFKDPETFTRQDAALYGEILKVEQKKTYHWVLKDLNYGEYALAVFHDLNNNGKLDKNLLGIPKEPYAFARKEPSKWRNPAFGEVSFQFEQAQQRLKVNLEIWKNR